ncbi:MAG: hypothetical protein LLG00_00285 [Planctomycetaceae bacterium]|nr:hypothetical protein [Planctomycetaceae bacterium]
MDTLQRQVRRARRRLAAERFLSVLAWCWFATLLVALVLVAIDKFWPTGIDAWVWLGGAVGVGLLAAMLWTFVVPSSLMDAAVEIDRRFELKERVSSAMSLTPADRQSEAGEALLADAVRRVERIDVGGRFVIKPPRRLLLPLAPGALAVLVALLVSPATDTAAQAKVAEQTAKEQIKKSTEVVRRQLAERRDEAKKQGLPEAEQLFKKIEQGTRELNAEPKKEKALAKLNELSRMLADRRQQLGGAEKIKQQLEHLKKVDQGPADKLAQAISRGDFKKAIDELKKLQDQLANSKLNDKQKADLAKQLDQMKDKLSKLADAQRAAEKDLQQRADRLRRAGQMAEANKLEEQLSKLRQQSPQMQQMKQLAQQCGNCSKCLKQGNQADAAKAMQQMQSSIDGLKRQLDEMQMLDDAMQQLAQAREQMTCKNCGGKGCSQCQGKMGDAGQGLGEGRGAGARPERKTNTRFYDSQAKQKVGQGAAAVVDTVEGPNIRGDVHQQIQQQVESAERGATDPLSGRRMPKKRGEHAKEYFDELRGK